MGAPKDNKFWRARSSHGKSPSFKSKEELWEACCEYFDWIEDNPMNKAIVYQGEVSVTSENIMRAMTISGLCLFLDICEKTWANYRNYKDYLQVTTRAERIIYNQKFAGAAAGLLNANIIARDLGLRDNQSVEHTGRIELSDLSDDDLQRKLEDLEND